MYGIIHEYRMLQDYPAEEFTQVYWIKYEQINAARFAKRKLDDKPFFGGILHVCYAPEYETIQDTRDKLHERSRVIARKTRKQGSINEVKSDGQQLSRTPHLDATNTTTTLDTENKKMLQSDCLPGQLFNQSVTHTHTCQYPELQPAHSSTGQYPELPPAHSSTGQYPELPPAHSSTGQYPEPPPAHSRSNHCPENTGLCTDLRAPDLGTHQYPDLPAPPKEQPYWKRRPIPTRSSFDHARVPSANATLPANFTPFLEPRQQEAEFVGALLPSGARTNSDTQCSYAGHAAGVQDASRTNRNQPSIDYSGSQAEVINTATSTNCSADRLQSGEAAVHARPMMVTKPRFVPRQTHALLKRKHSTDDRKESDITNHFSTGDSSLDRTVNVIRNRMQSMSRITNQTTTPVQSSSSSVTKRRKI
nr:PREDICTED: uncharacterized protein LOC100366729 isoform X2 [Saccoglossus kowalevskii]